MNPNRLLLKYISCFLLVFLFSFQKYAHSSETLPTLFQKLDTYDKLVIQTDLDSMLLNKRTENYQAATILFYGEDQTVLKFKAKIKARGKFRRLKCDIPPLKLNFPKSELAELGLQKKFDKFKLVGHCLLNGSANKAVLKEYCVYKMHNYIADFSFRVKSFTVIYQHDKDSERIIKGEGFLLEPNKEMAFRNEGELIDTLGLESTDVTSESYHHLLFFNYMIGNTDWSIQQQRNIKFLRKNGVDKLIIVPYDFDNCKLVSPPYLYSDKDSKRVRGDNRVVEEKFHSKEALYNELKFFQALEKYHLSNCYECEKLSQNEKKKMVKYLKPFYRSIKKIEKMQSLFLNE